MGLICTRRIHSEILMENSTARLVAEMQNCISEGAAIKLINQHNNKGVFFLHFFVFAVLVGLIGWHVG